MAQLQDTPTFYVTGGTLPADASSYVERAADRDLLTSLLAGEYCYVLNSRQMGKSSLMVRAAERLKAGGGAVAVLDLTAIGQNLTPEQWYDGLLARLGRQLDLEDELDTFYRDHLKLGPHQRWQQALTDVVLPTVTTRLVIFVDEIDVTRSLPFSADEFFAGVRQFYVGRATDSTLNRLTFCLLGTATPADLIQDTRTSPFNIGKRIEVKDFTPDEAAPLAEGLDSQISAEKNAGTNGAAAAGSEARRQKLLDRVLYWTGGHPYLTQRLCRSAMELRARTEDDVDRICTELFLTHTGKESDDNLSFVRNRLLRSEADLAALLHFYGKMRSGRVVTDDETNPLTSLLKLSGVARVEGGQLRVRNRIYAHVFDRKWVEHHMPDAELIRQRQAYRRGILRASAASLVLIVTISLLALAAVGNAREARLRAEQVRKAAVQLRRNLYVAEMNEAQQAVDSGNAELARNLLDKQIPSRNGDEDLREFAWCYLDSTVHRSDERLKLVGHNGPIATVAYSPNGKILATAGYDKTVRLWNAETGRQIVALTAHRTPVVAAVFSRDGSRLATLDGQDTSMRADLILWNMRTPAAPVQVAKYGWRAGSAGSLFFSPDGTMLIGTMGGWGGFRDLVSGREFMWSNFQAQSTPHFQSALSPDGRLLALFGPGKVAATGPSVVVYKVPPRASLSDREPVPLKSLKTQRGSVRCAAFSLDNKILACGSEDRTVDLWDTTTWRRIGTVHNNEAVRGVALSPDGKLLATGGIDGVVAMWDVSSQKQTARLQGHRRRISSLAFAPDGKSLASASDDGTIRIWDTAPRPDRTILAAQSHPARYLAVAPVGGLLATAGADSNVGVWRWPRFALAKSFRGTWFPYTAIAFSPDGGMLAAGSADDNIYLWDVVLGREILPSMPHWVTMGVAFSPDGRLLASASADGTAKLWDVATHGQLHGLASGHGMAYGVSFSPEGKWYSVCYDDGTLSVVDSATGRVVAALAGHSGAATTVAFSPDGKLLATGGNDGTVRFWNTSDWRRKPEILTSRLDDVSHLAFSPDGKTLATAHGRSGIALWNVGLRSEVATLRSDEFELIRVGFSPDGKALIASSGTGKVLIWDSASLSEAAAREKSSQTEREQLEANIPALRARIEGGRARLIEVLQKAPPALEVMGAARANLIFETGTSRVDVVAVDNTDWHVQLSKDMAGLTDGDSCVIQFRAKSDHPRTILLNTQARGGDYHGIGFATNVALTREWQTYKYSFRASKPASINKVPTLVLGKEKGTVWIADLTSAPGPAKPKVSETIK